MSEVCLLKPAPEHVIDVSRCMRHFAIYGQPWPRRIPLPGTVSFLPTPREEITPESPSKHVSHKALSTLDRKLAAAAAKTYGRPTKASKEERPLKKCKVESASAPVHNAKSLSSRAPPSTARPDSAPAKRRRGRPRLSSLPPSKVKKEDPPPPSFTEQVRTPPSRKNTGSASPQKSSPKRPPLSRAERASEREKQRALLEKEAQAAVQSKKRPNEEPDVFDDRPRKLLKVQPRPLSFRASKLFCKPNPLSFALEAWAGPLVADSDSSEDESGPVTPGDYLSKVENTVKIVQRSSTSMRSDVFKPSPFNFARRRWSSWVESSGRPTTRPKYSDSWSMMPDPCVSDEEVRVFVI